MAAFNKQKQITGCHQLGVYNVEDGVKHDAGESKPVEAGKGKRESLVATHDLAKVETPGRGTFDNPATREMDEPAARYNPP